MWTTIAVFGLDERCDRLRPSGGIGLGIGIGDSRRGQQNDCGHAADQRFHYLFSLDSVILAIVAWDIQSRSQYFASLGPSLAHPRVIVYFAFGIR